MEDTEKTKNTIIKIYSELPGIDGIFKQISIKIGEDGTPAVLAFF